MARIRMVQWRDDPGSIVGDLGKTIEGETADAKKNWRESKDNPGCSQETARSNHAPHRWSYPRRYSQAARV